MGLFNIFRNKKQLQSENAQHTFDGPTIFYHEDDFRQVEIIPNDNLSTLITESEKVDTFAKEHFDGFGYTEIYVRNDGDQIKLDQRRIAPNDLEKVLSSLGIDRISNVITGYGQSHRENHKDCVAFGKDYSAVYYDFKENIVEHIWLTNHWSLDREKLAKCLHDLGLQWDLVLQDWNLAITVNLKDMKSIAQYLSAHDEE